ncbi:hypothetical protein CDD83_10979 [Cordyceps sp. RAO-2017]|nr:hypothetical protein CDD83_10979 [Cordyceps sp. RAO-2017]
MDRPLWAHKSWQLPCRASWPSLFAASQADNCTRHAQATSLSEQRGVRKHAARLPRLPLEPATGFFSSSSLGQTSLHHDGGPDLEPVKRMNQPALCLQDRSRAPDADPDASPAGLAREAREPGHSHEDTSRHSRGPTRSGAAGTSYVQSWLSRIDTGSASVPAPAQSDKAPEAAREPWIPDGPLFPRPRPIRQATQSPSLFVRDSPLPSSSSRPSGHRESVLASPKLTADALLRHDKLPDAPPGPPISASGEGGDDYCKKPRRKTRHDRYDTRKRREPGEPGAKTKSRHSKKRKTDQPKRTLRSEREVMDNFASYAIAAERVTMKPNLGPGSFLNGRSSAAIQPADLAFYPFENTADDVQAKHARQHHHVEPPKSDSRRKAERDLQEDADFFANVKTHVKQKPGSTGSTSVQGSAVIVIGAGRTGTSGRRGRLSGRAATGSGPGPGQGQRTASKHGLAANDSVEFASPSMVSRLSDRESPSMGLEPGKRNVAGRDTKASGPSKPGPDDSLIESLLKTGVYDDTRISRRRIERLHSLKGDESRQQRDSVPPAQAAAGAQSRNYRDKGVMVSPGLDARGQVPCRIPSSRTRDPTDAGAPSFSGGAEWDQQKLRMRAAGRAAPKSDGRTRGRAADVPFAAENPFHIAAGPCRFDLPHRRGPTTHDFRASEHDDLSRQPGGGANRASRATAPPRAYEYDPYLWQPGGRPGVEPLHPGRTVPQASGRWWSSLGTASSRIPAPQVDRPTQPGAPDMGGRHARPTESGCFTDPMDETAGASAHAFVAGLDREALEQASARRPGVQADFEQWVAGPKHEADLRLYRMNTRDWADIREGPQRPQDRVGAFVGRQRSTGRWPWQQSHEAGDADTTSFWRPDCFAQGRQHGLRGGADG